MFTIKVVYQQDGKPAKNQKVSVAFDGWTRGVTGNEWTDDAGEAHFTEDPGRGTIYVGNKSIQKGEIAGRVVVYI
jgi:uncharacterized GH25 family protein